MLLNIFLRISIHKNIFIKFIYYNYVLYHVISYILNFNKLCCMVHNELTKYWLTITPMAYLNCRYEIQKIKTINYDKNIIVILRT